MFEEYITSVSLEFEGLFKDVLRKMPECLSECKSVEQDVKNVFHAKVLKWKFKKYFKSISKVLTGRMS